MIRQHGRDAEGGGKGGGKGGVSLFEDDLILCFGLQKATGLPSMLTPACPTWDESWRFRRLNDTDALCARPDHRERRDEFVRQAWACGWRFVRP
jgi:hypothetical protein